MATKKAKGQSRKKAAAKKAAATPLTSHKSSTKAADKSALPPKIFAQVSPRSLGGVSMFDGQEQIYSGTVSNFFSEAEVVQGAVARLQEAGFEILQISPMMINIAGSATTYRKAFDTNLVVEDRPVIKEMGRKDVAQFIDSPDTKLSGLIDTSSTKMSDVIEGVAIEEKRYPMGPSMFAPLKKYWHLRVPGDVSLACNADRAHRTGITGKGVKVAMADTGWFKHPYFVGRGYNVSAVTLGPGAANPLDDEVGHGTGESANIFANAPDVSFMPVKMSFVNSTGGFNAAVGLHPDIITCSWGSSTNGPLSAADQALAAAIAAAVASGITVIFSAGNGHFGFPGQHPDVISAGGAFMDIDESLRASDYASGFISQIYPNRRVPDLCGLVGMKPKAIYIMLPVQPGDEIDATPSPGGLQGGTFPNGDETTNNDGWGAFSGTSAAAPQLAGVAALIKQACPSLKPANIKDIMRKTARDVTAGNCNTSTGGFPATVGPDTATGDGLVDAAKAVMLAKVKCLGPIVGPPVPIIGPPVPIVGPPTPIVGPPTPIVGPPQPILPVKPIQPIQPVKPIQPGPIQPVQPIKPIAPIVNPGPITTHPASEEAGGGEASGGSSTGSMSAEDVDQLSQMVIDSEIDLDL
jgi:subtilisin family serine protease